MKKKRKEKEQAERIQNQSQFDNNIKMFFQSSTLILLLLITFNTPIKSSKNCKLDYDRHKKRYDYPLTYHCSNLNSLSNGLLKTNEISKKKLPLKISSSSNLHIHREICGYHRQKYLLVLLIESSYVRTIGSRAFSCHTLRVLSISHTKFALSLLPDDIFLHAYQLQTIRFVHTNIKRLPSSLENLSNLTELILDGEHSLIAYPSIENLISLRYLHIFTSLNYFPLNYVDHLNSFPHIKIVHFGSRTINMFPKEIFRLAGYHLTDVSLYSENITCRTCKSDWFKTTAKTVMLYGWINRTKDQFRSANFHSITEAA